MTCAEILASLTINSSWISWKLFMLESYSFKISNFDVSSWLFNMKTIEERKSILDKEIFKLVNHGWVLSHRSDTKCLLIKAKKVNGCLLTILLLLFIVPGIIYILMSKGKSTLKIDITEEGNIIYFPTGLSIFEKNVVESY
jgi:hypothetical protein